ncbi:hypothetical protein PHYPSEUDO_011421 [Phytophthora pseudosyringae]|uniref:Rhodanese domain-containing protein n=1 Tax=Phytophthora pseudosyringae TaxID=221518 RepID=A0A8T1V9D0_9STRA|nr:hypothetical protein PHYPSEUDO_011421 [Phytophthora pseudosyringae]
MLLRRLQSLRGPVRRWVSTRSGGSGVAEPRQYVSLYNYVELEESELPKLRRRLLGDWKALSVSGRIYLSPEGINGQLVLPQSNVTALAASFPQIFTSTNMFYGQLLPPLEEKSTVGRQPFSKLTVRKLKHRNETDDSDTLVLDVRNFYEHEIGRFDGATRIMVDTFRDTFDALDEILEKHEKEHDGQKPREVMMYCTGGIRCEKVGAYLTQYKGISNVQKLHGGIVNYMRFLKEQRQAASFFAKSSHASQITAVNQDGLDYLSSLSTRAARQPFDFIFVDANKRKYRAYYDFILQHQLLHPSGLLVFDNTLFRGRVAAYAGGAASNKERIARGLAEFNSYVAQDTRTSQVVVPLWDGLTLVRLKQEHWK